MLLFPPLPSLTCERVLEAPGFGGCVQDRVSIADIVSLSGTATVGSAGAFGINVGKFFVQLRRVFDVLGFSECVCVRV